MPDDHEATRNSISSLTALRVYKLLARTVHLIAIAGLVGGHMFGAPLASLRPFPICPLSPARLCVRSRLILIGTSFTRDGPYYSG